MAIQMRSERDGFRDKRALHFLAWACVVFFTLDHLPVQAFDELPGGKIAGVRKTCAPREILITSAQDADRNASRDSRGRARSGIAGLWRLPGVAPVSRAYPHLANYFHMDLPESHVDHASARLAQWDVVILNHDLVTAKRISLRQMRMTNPNIKVLAWVPLQGPNEGMSRGVPKRRSNDWYGRRADGEYLVPHWGGHLMNPYVCDHAWLRHVLRYVRDVCIGPGLYDGIMLDCLWHGPPAEMDVNCDGQINRDDELVWREAMVFLLRMLRSEFPKTVIVGNGGLPWPVECPYYEFVNGCMHENALGDQFGGTEWSTLWNSFRIALSRISMRPVIQLVQVDVRADGRAHRDAMRLRSLTQNDARRFRLGLATTLLMDGGYFGFDRGDCLHGQLWWFDEYECNLGKPIDSCREGVYGTGVLSRQFENGLVIVNPTDEMVTAAITSGLPSSSSGAGRVIQVPANDARILVNDFSSANAP